MSADLAAVGHFRAGEQPNERRLAGAVDAEHTIIVSGQEHGGRILQHDFAPAGHRVGFGDVIESDHSGSLSLARNPRSTANPASSKRIARMTR